MPVIRDNFANYEEKSIYNLNALQTTSETISQKIKRLKTDAVGRMSLYIIF